MGALRTPTLTLLFAGQVVGCDGTIVEPRARGGGAIPEAMVRDDGALVFDDGTVVHENGMAVDEQGRPVVDPRCVGEAPAGAGPLRRVTEEQWRATVESLFGAGTTEGIAFPRALYRRGFRTDAVIGEISRDGAVALGEAAASIAERVVTDDLAALLGCSPGASGDDPCVAGFIDELAARAFRRPLRAEERTALNALYADLRTREALTERESVTGVVEAILASPQLSYLTSDVLAVNGAAIELDGHGIAERLSFFLWNEPPDDDLRAAAAAGRLRTPAHVEEAARRMVTDPRTARMLGGFVEDWLHIHRVRGMAKDRATYPAWSAGLSDAVLREHYAFVEEVMLRDDHRLATLLGAPFAVVDPQLAALYGTAETQGRAMLGPERRGILNLSGFLAGHAGSSESAPVLRGVTVIRQLFCEELELPVGVAVPPVPIDPSRTARERFAAHRARPACAGCHDRIDPIGFAFEDFDGVGGYRTRDAAGRPVDATGRIADLTRSIDVAVDGGAGVGVALATSPLVQHCFARQMLTYAEGRALGVTAPEAALDACALSHISARFSAADGDIRELLVAIATSNTFMRRRVNG